MNQGNYLLFFVYIILLFIFGVLLQLSELVNCCVLH